jgi:hypothetical protein
MPADAPEKIRQLVDEQKERERKLNICRAVDHNCARDAKSSAKPTCCHLSITSSASARSIGGTSRLERSRGIEVDHQLEPGGLHNRQVHGLGVLEEACERPKDSTTKQPAALQNFSRLWRRIYVGGGSSSTSERGSYHVRKPPDRVGQPAEPDRRKWTKERTCRILVRCSRDLP